MDQALRPAAADPLVLTGLGHVVAPPAGPRCDPLPVLKQRKLRKFMGVQDDLMVVAAAAALGDAGLDAAAAGDRVGLYLSVGYIPFEAADIDALHDSSVDAGEFSLPRFSTAGLRSINPLLTFRCLPNMPAFHVSVNCGVTGPYVVTYPGPGQLYLALEQAVMALELGQIDAALVGGVAHQRNFLVEHHFSRLTPPVPAADLRDAAGLLVLERAARAAARGARVRGALREVEVRYTAHDPLAGGRAARDVLVGAPAGDLEVGVDLGAASLPVRLARAGRPAVVTHELVSRDGIDARSVWELR